MKKYKLRKDLAFLKKGTEIWPYHPDFINFAKPMPRPNFCYGEHKESRELLQINAEFVENSPDWFEEVKCEHPTLRMNIERGDIVSMICRYPPKYKCPDCLEELDQSAFDCMVSYVEANKAQCGKVPPVWFEEIEAQMKANEKIKKVLEGKIKCEPVNSQVCRHEGLKKLIREGEGWSMYPVSLMKYCCPDCKDVVDVAEFANLRREAQIDVKEECKYVWVTDDVRVTQNLSKEPNEMVLAFRTNMTKKEIILACELYRNMLNKCGGRLFTKEDMIEFGVEAWAYIYGHDEYVDRKITARKAFEKWLEERK
jgi:hypothetical protein